MRFFFQTKAVDKKTHFMFNNFSPPQNRAVYEIVWKNILEPGSSQITMWRMCIVIWTPKAKNALSEYVLLIAFPLQQYLR